MKLLNNASLIAFVALFFSCKTRHFDASAAIHKYMTSQKEEITHVFPQAEISIVEDSIHIIFNDGIMFNTGQSAIKDEMLIKFIRFAEVLNKYNNTKVIYNGHTDNIGSDQYNFKLSTERANSAKTLTISSGVKASRLYAYGLGKRYPMASNDTEEGRARNRRIEIIILYDEN